MTMLWLSTQPSSANRCAKESVNGRSTTAVLGPTNPIDERTEIKYAHLLLLHEIGLASHASDEHDTSSSHGGSRLHRSAKDRRQVREVPRLRRRRFRAIACNLDQTRPPQQAASWSTRSDEVFSDREQARGRVV